MLVLVFIICCVLYYWNNENIKKAQGFPIEDRNQLRRKKLRLFLSTLLYFKFCFDLCGRICKSSLWKFGI